MRTQDIDAYMAAIPADFVIRDAAGEAITREQLRANVLRDWSIIPKTLSISVTVYSIVWVANCTFCHPAKQFLAFSILARMLKCAISSSFYRTVDWTIRREYLD